MPAQVIDGNAIAASIRTELAKQVERLRGRDVLPHLAVILGGDDAASASYVRAKERGSEQLGVSVMVHRIAGDRDPGLIEQEMAGLIRSLNGDPAVDGIILQLPVPEGVNEDRLLGLIDPFKDVDGLHPENQGRLLQNRARYFPATPHGVQQMLVRSGNAPDHKHVVVVGRSRLVGLPLATMLMQKRAGANATVTVCHTGTADLGEYTRQADILIAAAGRPEMIRADLVREGAVVIDVGVNRVDDATRPRGYRLVGDVAFDEVAEKAGAITPVPGGVGPMTVTMLLANVVRAASQFRSGSGRD